VSRSLSKYLVTRRESAASSKAEQSSVDVPALLWQALRCAARRDADPQDDEPVSAAEAAEHLDVLWNAVSQAAEGKVPSLVGLPHTIPVPRLLSEARRSFLKRARDVGPSAELGEVLRYLGALEEVQAAYDRDCAQQFAGRLCGPRGLDLVVEVAHDMRSPLTSILFLVEMLRRGQSGAVTKMQERQLGLVYSAAFGLSTLASDVIELAKGGTRLVESQPVPFSVGEILESVRDIVQPMAEEKGLAMKLIRPDQDGRLGHPAALSRVLLNLTTNALKFTSSGTVTVAARADHGDRMHFAVADTGRGIPDDVLGSLFDAFRRRGDIYSFSSAGLGLSICRKLVTAMGGRLEVATRPGEGACFVFSIHLPLASSTQAAAEHSERPARSDDLRSLSRQNPVGDSRADHGPAPRAGTPRAGTPPTEMPQAETPRTDSR
jgi:signal transduction histidine kinase